MEFQEIVKYLQFFKNEKMIFCCLLPKNAWMLTGSGKAFCLAETVNHKIINIFKGNYELLVFGNLPDAGLSSQFDQL